jgi:Phage integrase family
MMPKAEYEVFEALNPFFEVVMEGLRGLVDGDHYFDTIAEDAFFEFRYSGNRHTRKSSIEAGCGETPLSDAGTSSSIQLGPIGTCGFTPRYMLKRAGFHCRFHDLRVTCITKLAESQASEQTIMAIAGHVSRRMLEHYSRIRTEAKRIALEAISGPVFQAAVHQNVNQLADTKTAEAAKLLN